MDTTQAHPVRGVLLGGFLAYLSVISRWCTACDLIHVDTNGIGCILLPE
ncbi:MAG: hypothetical protein H6Q86_4187 [candidate division NC10 bacterium]|jgi:hypothetical protein|nr:hypothetical protein [candidate division NC10 bacterium]